MLFRSGKVAGSKIKSLNLKKANSDIIKTIDISKENCEVVSGSEIKDGSWSVTTDNQGVLSCKTSLDDGERGIYTVKADVSHTSNKGGFLIDWGREPGRTFVAGKLESARDTDWERNITLKNRRHQKKESEKVNSTEADLTVADMVDYHRSSLLIVNKIPRIFNFEVDELQPDRMRKLELIFNNGTASISYSAVADPNHYASAPAGFKDSPDGFVDPSKEKYSLTFKQGGTEKIVQIDNPIDAWGRLTVNLDDLQNKLGVEIQPFLEGRNHIRVYSENRDRKSVV